jgi:hypothetical protein
VREENVSLHARSLIGVMMASLACVAATGPRRTDEAFVREAEGALADARAHDDRVTLADLLANEYSVVDRFGRVHARDVTLSSAETVSVCESVHIHGSVAITVAHQGDTRVLRVWIMRDARWQVVAEQYVAIQPGRQDPDASWNAADVREAPPLEATSMVHEVLRAQDALDRANAMRDPTTFARLTSADFIVITNHGLLRSKSDRIVEERMARLEGQPERPRPLRDDVRVRVFGSVAIVTARNWPRTFEGAPRPPMRYTRVWIKTPGGWQQAANISTFIAD